MPANVGFDVRLGLVAHPCNLFYLSVGPDWGYLQVKTEIDLPNITGSLVKKDSEFITGVRFGVGAEQKLSSCFVMREQFSYSWYESIKVTDSVGVEQKLSSELATFVFSLGYLF